MAKAKPVKSVNHWHHHTTWFQHRHNNMTQGQRMADSLAQFLGSWKFIIWQSLVVTVWIALNIYGIMEQWDPYPFVLLNLVFAAQSAYAAPIIMMSQNRQAERDRAQAEADFHTTLEIKAKIESLEASLQKALKK